MPDAARISDHHVCPKAEPGPVPHVGGPVFAGSATVIVGFLPAARVGDSTVCFPVGPQDSIEAGSASVVIDHHAAARRGDACSHQGALVGGCPTVVIGGDPQHHVMQIAAERGTPFCEECERRRRLAAVEAMDPRSATLDDDHPPPGAHPGRDRLKLAGGDLQRLAAEQDCGDGLDHERRAARVAVAYSFYADPAIGASFKPSRITSHLRAIDVSKPLEIIELGGRTYHQRGIPGLDDGQYFTEDDVTKPEHVGVSSEVYPKRNGLIGPPPEPRDRRKRVFSRPTRGLKSIAARVLDSWSMPRVSADPGRAVDCAGGGTQVMIPHPHHSADPTRQG